MISLKDIHTKDVAEGRFPIETKSDEMPVWYLIMKDGSVLFYDTEPRETDLEGSVQLLKSSMDRGALDSYKRLERGISQELEDEFYGSFLEVLTALSRAR